VKSALVNLLAVALTVLAVLAWLYFSNPLGSPCGVPSCDAASSVSNAPGP
jgi:hypothetical protein